MNVSCYMNIMFIYALVVVRIGCCTCVATVLVPLQTVTGVPHADDVNSYWLVKGVHGVDTNCQRG